MPKCHRLVVLGASSVGKTAVIEQAAFGNHSPGKPMFRTIEDIYDVLIETERGGKEKVRIYDTAGLETNTGEVSRHYVNLADGFVLVYSVTSKRSFQLVQAVKKDIDKQRGKDFPVIVLGTKTDIEKERECDSSWTAKWAEGDRVRLFEVFVGDRRALQDPFMWITTKMLVCSGKGYLQSGHSEMRRYFSMRKTSKSMSVSKDSGLDATKE